MGIHTRRAGVPYLPPVLFLSPGALRVVPLFGAGYAELGNTIAQMLASRFQFCKDRWKDHQGAQESKEKREREENPYGSGSKMVRECQGAE